MTQMVSEITELSRIETGRAELKKEPININMLIREVVAQMNPLADNLPVIITTSLDPGLPIVKS